ncbi:YrdB family protein [Cucumibacter marinus]|uniref:YrdB family protein n=1 Tax=Cucumibacter marinus TaxID=1121252 RepID=UPI00138B0F33|nr:YrdB family protein [Cucumibacter marinus]
MDTLNKAVAFGLEIAVVAAVAYWAYGAGGSPVWGIASAVVGAMLVILLWGAFAAPRAERRLSGVALLVFKAVIFGAGALALIAVSQWILAIILAGLAAGHLWYSAANDTL